MDFWRQEFTKIMDGDKFEKSYSYNIRYNYGKVGNRTDYSPYSCHKIIMNNVGPGEHHGCPFRHWDLPILKQKLVEYGISSEGKGLKNVKVFVGIRVRLQVFKFCLWVEKRI